MRISAVTRCSSLAKTQTSRIYAAYLRIAENARELFVEGDAYLVPRCLVALRAGAVVCTPGIVGSLNVNM